MAQPKVIDVDYYVLVQKMKQAANGKALIEKKDKEKWDDFVNRHQVRVTSLEAFGKVKFASGKPKLVAIELGTDWDGCYAYSHDDEAALKFVPA